MGPPGAVVPPKDGARVQPAGSMGPPLDVVGGRHGRQGGGITSGGMSELEIAPAFDRSTVGNPNAN